MRHLKARPLNWRKGDDAHNLRELAMTSFENTAKAILAIRDTGYNFLSPRFEKLSDGTPVTDADFDRIASNRRGFRLHGNDSQLRTTQSDSGRLRGEGAESAGPVPANRGGEEAAPIGRATLKRAAITHTLVRETGPGGWNAVLAQLARQSGAEQLDSALSDTYRRSPEARPSAGLSVAAVRAVTDPIRAK